MKEAPDGDGIGFCGCPRCDCGECRYCADALSCHGETCADDDWDDYDDEGDYDDGPPPRPTLTLDMRGDLL